MIDPDEIPVEVWREGPPLNIEDQPQCVRMSGDILSDPKIPMALKGFYCILVSHCDEDRVVQGVTRAQLADTSGVDPRTITTWVADLAKLGIIRVDVAGTGERRPNRYILTDREWAEARRAE